MELFRNFFESVLELLGMFGELFWNLWGTFSELFGNWLGTGWEFVVEDVLGEFFISEYLDVQLSESNGDRAAAGWGGDRYVVHWNEELQQIVLVLATEWDSAGENNQFVESYINYATRKYSVDGVSNEDGAICWQGEDFTCLYQTETGATIVRAPSRKLILALIALTQ